MNVLDDLKELKKVGEVFCAGLRKLCLSELKFRKAPEGWIDALRAKEVVAPGSGRNESRPMRSMACERRSMWWWYLSKPLQAAGLLVRFGRLCLAQPGRAS